LTRGTMNTAKATDLLKAKPVGKWQNIKSWTHHESRNKNTAKLTWSKLSASPPTVQTKKFEKVNIGPCFQRALGSRDTVNWDSKRTIHTWTKNESREKVFYSFDLENFGNSTNLK
jgi:hypothetical protein